MKNISKIAKAFLGALFIVSCASNGVAQTAENAPDTYEIEDEEETKTAITKESKAKKEKSSRTGIADLFSFGNKGDYVEYEDASLFSKEITGLKEQKAVVVIRTDNHNAGFGSSFSGGYYYIQFDNDSRQKLLKAIDSYFADFDNRVLSPKAKHADKAYGKISYRLDWGSIKSSTPNNGSGTGYCGYEFIKKSPYFCIYNYPFANDYYKVAGESTTRESKKYQVYFTRAQLRQLKEVLSDETINGVLYGSPVEETVPVEADEY